MFRQLISFGKVTEKMMISKKILYFAMTLSLVSLGCSTSSSSSSASGYDISASTITRADATFPQSFSITGTKPTYDSAVLLKSPLTEKQFAAIAIKASGSSLGFAIGSYNSNGRLLYKILFQFTTDTTVFPDKTTTSRTYTLTNGTADCSASSIAGLAPTWSRETGISASATISYVAATASDPAGYTITLTPASAIADATTSTNITAITADASGSTL